MDPDPYSEYGSTKVLNMNPIRIHNTSIKVPVQVSIKANKKKRARMAEILDDFPRTHYSGHIFSPTCIIFSVSDPYSSNPDPAKNRNPDPSYFLPLSEFFYLLHNYKFFSPKEVN